VRIHPIASQYSLCAFYETGLVLSTEDAAQNKPMGAPSLTEKTSV
jgi:hypothetical protein